MGAEGWADYQWLLGSRRLEHVEEQDRLLPVEPRGIVAEGGRHVARQRRIDRRLRCRGVGVGVPAGDDVARRLELRGS